MAPRIAGRYRPRPSSPTHAMSAAYSRSWLRSKQPPPSARHARPHDPEPSAPLETALQERICSSSCLSWLHLLKSWSLRQSRGGSWRVMADHYCAVISSNLSDTQVKTSFVLPLPTGAGKTEG